MTSREQEIVAALASEIVETIAELDPNERAALISEAIEIVGTGITRKRAPDVELTQKMIDAAIREFLDDRSLFSEQTKRHIRVSIHPAMRRALMAALALAPKKDDEQAIERARAEGQKLIVDKIRRAIDMMRRDIRLVSSGENDPWRRGAVYALTKIIDVIDAVELDKETGDER